MNLNELEALYREIEAKLDDPEFDVLTLYGFIEAMLTEKVDGYCFVIGKLNAREAWAKEEANRLSEKARRAKNEAQRLRSHLLWFLQERGITRMTTNRYRVSIVSVSKPPLIIDEGIRPEDVPDAFRRVKYEFDLDAIREQVELGAISWARIAEPSKSLRIK